MKRHPLFLPGLIALATAIGLVAGLIGDGGWDLAAWAGLALPVGVAVYAVARR